MTNLQLQASKRKIREHYHLTRPVTLAEVLQEIANLRRRGIDGLDDSQMALACTLQTGKHPIELFSH